ncbi:hypothetical protein ACFL23_03835 [Patescibacteria group bacterium]
MASDPPLTPSLISPNDEESLDTLTPTFEWSAYQHGGDSETQAGYQIYVYVYSDIENSEILVYDTGFVSATAGNTHVYSPGIYTGVDPITSDTRISEQLKWGNSYYWRVRYRDSGGDWSDWSGVWAFFS